MSVQFASLSLGRIAKHQNIALDAVCGARTAEGIERINAGGLTQKATWKAGL